MFGPTGPPRSRGDFDRPFSLHGAAINRRRPQHLLSRRPGDLDPGHRRQGATGQLLGAQLVGHRGTEIAKRVDIYATALFHGMTVEAMADLDLLHPAPRIRWDAVRVAAQA